MSRRIVVLASRNPDKVREMAELCEGLPFEIRSTADYPGLPEILEDGTTTLGNATRKAVATAAFTGEIAVADDTALRVEALGGLPDVFAARFAGPRATYADNCRLLHELMTSVPDGRRQALFLTAAVWVDPRPRDRGPGADAVVGADARLRWLHAPSRRPVHLARSKEEAKDRDPLMDRRTVWRDYLDWAQGDGPVPGVDRERLAAILGGLAASVAHGGRPNDADAEAIHVSDTRIWTAAGLDDTQAPTAQMVPNGLPSPEPGSAVNEAVWCEVSAVGRVIGEIVHLPRGRQGFGYDPLFRPLGGDRTLAEMSAEEKNALSHRGRAIRRLLSAASRLYTR